MTHNYTVGDRVLASDFHHENAPGAVVKEVDDGFVIRLDTPTSYCYFEDDTARFFDSAGLKPEPVEAPLAVSSKPRPKAPIKPGSRHEQVLNHLLTGKTLTQGEGIVLGYGTRVAATVHDLRRRGHTITTTMKEDLHGSPYAEYRLVTRRANGNRKAA